VPDLAIAALAWLLTATAVTAIAAAFATIEALNHG